MSNYKDEKWLEEKILRHISSEEWATAEAVGTFIMAEDGCITSSGLMHALGKLAAEGQIESLKILNGDRGKISFFYVYRKPQEA